MRRVWLRLLVFIAHSYCSNLAHTAGPLSSYICILVYRNLNVHVLLVAENQLLNLIGQLVMNTNDLDPRPSLVFPGGG